MFRRIFGSGADHEQAAAAAETAFTTASTSAGDTATVRRIVAELEAMPPERARLVASAAYTLARAAHADLDISDEETAIIEREPDWSALPAQTPKTLTRLLQRCLEKDPKQRLRDIGDVRVELEERAAITPELPRSGWLRVRRPRALWAAVGVAVTAVFAAAIGWTLKPTSTPAVSRFTHVLDEDTPFTDASRSLVAIAPDACYLPAAVQGEGRVFGPTAQLYTLRSGRNWGIGDFTDLRTVLEQWSQRGAAIVGLNPLHALFPHDPARASPYSPSSRLYLDVLYLDPEQIEELHESPEAQRLIVSAPFRALIRRRTL